MNIFKVLLLASISTTMLASCGYKYAAENKAKMEQVKIGMSKMEVYDILGEPENEIYADQNLWFYYTTPQWYDGVVTQDECTPFVFNSDGLLVGWGRNFLKTYGTRVGKDYTASRSGKDLKDELNTIVIWKQEAIEKTLRYP